MAWIKATNISYNKSLIIKKMFPEFSLASSIIKWPPKIFANKRKANVKNRIVILNISIYTIKHVIKIIKLSCEKCVKKFIKEIFNRDNTLCNQKVNLNLIIRIGHKGNDI